MSRFLTTRRSEWLPGLAILSVAICVAGFLYFTKLELLTPAKETASAAKAVPSPLPSPAPTQSAQATPSPVPPPIPPGERLVANAVPFIGERVQAALQNEYVPGVDYKAIALNIKDDATFSWTVTIKGKPQVIAGNWSLAGGILTLAQENQGSAMVGNLTWQDANHLQFRALGTTPEDPGLLFTR